MNCPSLLQSDKRELPEVIKFNQMLKYFGIHTILPDWNQKDIKYIREKGLNKEYGDDFYIFIKNDWLKYFLRSEEPELVLEWFNICIKKGKIGELSPKSATNRVFPDSPKKLIECFLPSITHHIISAASPPPMTIPITSTPRPISRKASRHFSSRSMGKAAQISKPINPPSYHKKIWIAFGINNYKNLQQLKNAVNDAEKLTVFSKEKLNFTYTKLILNEEVTKRRIEYEIKNYLYKNSSPEDLVVMSFHVHGITLNINDTHHGFIAPHNVPNDATPAELISMSDISNWTKYIKARHVLILFDCCFSGFSSLRKTKQSDKFSTYTIKKMLTKKSRIAINAGTHDQTVSDGGWNRNSIFTGVLLSYPFLNNKKGSVIHLYNYLLTNVPKYYPQTPTMGKLIGDEGGDIFLSL